MKSAIGLACLMMLFTQNIYSGVTITGTRIIFPSNKNAVGVQLNNPAEQPALVQAWLDDGDPKKIPEANQVPFILTPPLVQIDAKKGQMIRILSKDTTQLPQDRESLYWFNILDIPPTDADSTQNKLLVSIRSRIKLLYRPTTLKMSQDKAFNSLKFSYVNTSKSIRVENPTPYFINFYDVAFEPKDEKFTYREPLMVEPFSATSFKPNLPFIPKQVFYNLINDYGANQSFTSELNNIEK